jgi:fructokinase
MPKTVVVIGEALWDLFPDQRRPGGAPCNVACHAALLGDRGVIITRVGEDAAGEELVAFLRGRGVVTDYVQRDEARPTGTVSVTIEDSDPRYAIAEDVAWDRIAARDEARAIVRAADAVCVGSLAQRREPSRAAIRRLLSDAHGQALVVFDVNLRAPFIDADVIEATLRVADVVKMNESEVALLSILLDRPSLVRWLLQDVGAKAVCVTRGEGGASITTAQGTVSTRERYPRPARRSIRPRVMRWARAMRSRPRWLIGSSGTPRLERPSKPQIVTRPWWRRRREPCPRCRPRS